MTLWKKDGSEADVKITGKKKKKKGSMMTLKKKMLLVNVLLQNEQIYMEKARRKLYTYKWTLTFPPDWPLYICLGKTTLRTLLLFSH